MVNRHYSLQKIHDAGSTIGSVTGWINGLANDDPDAFEKIWGRFVSRLRVVAERRLSRSPCRFVDEDDIVNEAFIDFLQKGPHHFKQLVNRIDLWQVLSTITERRAIDAVRKEIAVKRGGGNVVNCPDEAIAELASRNCSPDLELMLVESFSHRLAMLKDDRLAELAIGKLDGLSNQELSNRFDIGLRSVERKLALIREIWSGDDQ